MNEQIISYQHKYMQTEWVMGKVLPIGNYYNSKDIENHKKNNILIEQSAVA